MNRAFSPADPGTARPEVTRARRMAGAGYPLRPLARGLALGLVLSLALGLTAAPVPAQALYRYTNEKGEVVYSDTPSGEVGGAVKRLSRNGTRLSTTPAGGGTAGPAPEPGRVATEAPVRTREQEDQDRRNAALLATYGNAGELEAARSYALREPMAALRVAQTSMVSAGRQLNRLRGRGEPVSGSEAAQQLDAARFDFRTQAQLTENKLQELQAIHARFDADLQRFNELTRAGQTATPAGSNAPAAPPAARR
jgi:hypothetical protein